MNSHNFSPSLKQVLFSLLIYGTSLTDLVQYGLCKFVVWKISSKFNFVYVYAFFSESSQSEAAAIVCFMYCYLDFSVFLMMALSLGKKSMTLTNFDQFFFFNFKILSHSNCSQSKCTINDIGNFLSFPDKLIFLLIYEQLTPATHNCAIIFKRLKKKIH